MTPLTPLVLVRVVAIYFGASSLANLMYSVFQIVMINGPYAESYQEEGFNWLSLHWIITPVSEAGVAVILWFAAPWIVSKIQASKTSSTIEANH